MFQLTNGNLELMKLHGTVFVLMFFTSSILYTSFGQTDNIFVPNSFQNLLAQFNDPGTVTGHVYYDVNDNGTQDQGEPGIEGVGVLIVNITNNNNATTVFTDENGDWSLTTVAGNIAVFIQVEQLWNGFTISEGSSFVVDEILENQTTDLGSSGFAYYTDVQGHLYYDLNGNGEQDDIEPDMPGVDVEVTDFLNNTFQLSTDIDGNWQTNLIMGEITVDIDQNDSDFPIGASQTEGTDPSVHPLELDFDNQPDDVIFIENDGFFESGEISGLLYDDLNNNGTQDSGEPGISDVDIIITTFVGETVVVETDANGEWSSSVPLGTTISQVDTTDPDFPNGAVQTEGTNPTTTEVVLNQSYSEIDGFFKTGQLSGHLYFDQNGNGTQDSGEPNMPDVDVEIVDGIGQTFTETTDANGNWTRNVSVGTATTTIDISDPDFPTDADQTEGSNPTSFNVVNGETYSEIDGFYATGILSGHLYFDVNGNGTQDGNEPNMPNVDVEITDAFGEIENIETDANGNWTIELPLGDATSNIDQNDPDFPTNAIQTEGSNPTTSTIQANQTIEEVNGFFESGEISGHLYFDINGNGTQDTGESDMPNVDVEITDALGQTQIVSTDIDGNWSTVVAAGTATTDIDFNDSDFPTGATQTQGSNPTITNVNNGGVFNEIDGFFESGTLEGTLYYDLNQNGTQDASETGISDVSVDILTALGDLITIETDENGEWSILVPEGTTVSEIDINDPDFPTGAIQTEGSNPTTTDIANGDTESEANGFYAFGNLSGHLYFDENGNGTQDGNEPNMPNIDVEITDVLGNTYTEVTDASGDWSIELPIGNATSNIDQNDPDFPTGATQTEGTNPTTTTILSGQTLSEIDGFFQSGTLTGHLYFDENGNGTQDGNEPNMPNVDVEITDVYGEIEIIETNANGDWSIELPLGDATSNIDQNDPDFPTGATQTEGTDPTTTTIVSGQTFSEIDGFYETGTLTGHLYFDENGNGTQDTGEPNMPNVDVEIIDVLGNIYTEETDANGDWSLELPIGDATSNIDQNDPDFPTGATQTEGTNPTTTTILSGQTLSEIDGFFQSGTLTGHLYFDENGNGTQDGNEPNMPNVDVEITDVYGEIEIIETNANGDWSIELPLGDATSNIDQNDPDFPTGATQTEGTDPTTSTVVTGQTISEIDGFFESGELTGHLYFDQNGNGTQDAGEPDIPNVDVEITDVYGAIQTVTTDINGDWSVELPVGISVSNINQNDPDFPTGATQTQGSNPTVSLVTNGFTAQEVDGFYESGTVMGHVYFDINGNEEQDFDEPNMPNVDVDITTSLGDVITVETNINGDWNLTVPIGVTIVDIDQNDPDFPTGATQTEGTDPTNTDVALNQTYSELDGFYESAEIAGHLYFDLNGNGTQDNNEPDMPNVDVEILDALGNTQNVTTNANGDWSLLLPAGLTQTDIDQNDADFPAGATQTEGTDPTTFTLINGNDVEDINGFFESGELSGHLYFDVNGNGTQDNDEPDMPSVDVEITTSQNETFITTTDINGNWNLTVPTGSTTVDINQNDPDFPTGAVQTEGTDPTTTNVALNQSYSEIDGFYETGELSGHLYFDNNGNGTQDANEPDMPNVDIEITNSLGETQVVTTDANGDWSVELPAGSTLTLIDENDADFPIGATQTEGTNPTNINVINGDSVSEINGFFESGELSGLLYFDINNNGMQDIGEGGIPNINVEIITALGDLIIVETDANGFWSLAVPIGSTESYIDVNDPDFPIGMIQTDGTNPTTSNIPIADVIYEVDGFHQLIELTGHLYFDENGNGTQDMNEPNMPDVDVEITNSLGEVEMVTTNNNGDWSVFVPVGNTVSDIDETDSDFPEGAVQTEGSNPTSTVVTISDSPVFSENDGFFTGIEIFNAVSTNEDGFENNFFRIDGIQAFPDNNLKIYNRQGVKVFDVKGYGQSNTNLFTGVSDGNVTIQKDKKLPTGTYFYVLTFTNQNGDREEYKGYLHLN